MNEWMEELINERMNSLINEWTNGWVNEGIYRVCFVVMGNEEVGHGEEGWVHDPRWPREHQYTPSIQEHRLYIDLILYT